MSKCCSEFNIAAAFKAGAVYKVVALSAYSKPFLIKSIITLLRGSDFCNISLNQLIIIAVTALKKKASFTFLLFHYLSIMNLTTLQAGIFAMKPSAVTSKSVNSSVFTAFLFSNVLCASITPVRISAFTDLTAESAI